jgi:hypothetical protein
MDPARRVAPFVVPYPHHPRRILKQSQLGREGHLRGVGRQVKLTKGKHARVDNDVLRSKPGLRLVHDPKKVAGLHRQGTYRVVSSLSALQSVADVVLAKGSEGDDLAPERRCSQGDRQRLMGLEPRHREPP